MEKHRQSFSKESHAVLPIDDSEFESAVSSLNTTTSLIKQECERLKAQTLALRKIRSTCSRRASSAVRASAFKSKLARERARLEHDCDEITESLQLRTRMASRQAADTVSNDHSNIARLLDKDDRFLAGLEKAFPQLLYDSEGISPAQAPAQDVNQLCHALIISTNAEIRARIDTAYTSASDSCVAQVNGSGKQKYADTSQQLRESLQTELAELCQEVHGLSSMAVDSRYRNPITLASRIANSELRRDKTAWCEYLHTMLQYLISRSDLLSQRFLDLQGRKIVLQSVRNALQEVVEMHAEKDLSDLRQSSLPNKQLQKGLKPLRLVQANLSEHQDPTTQFLRSLDARISEDFLAANDGSTHMAIRSKADDTVACTQKAPDPVAGSISRLRSDVQAIKLAVYMLSRYGSVHLESDAVQVGTQRLDDRIKDLSDRLRDLSTGNITKTGR